MIPVGTRVTVRLPRLPEHTATVIRSAHYVQGCLVYRVRYDLDGVRALVTASYVVGGV